MFTNKFVYHSKTNTRDGDHSFSYSSIPLLFSLEDKIVKRSPHRCWVSLSKVSGARGFKTRLCILIKIILLSGHEFISEFPQVLTLESFLLVLIIMIQT